MEREREGKMDGERKERGIEERRECKRGERKGRMKGGQNHKSKERP